MRVFSSCSSEFVVTSAKPHLNGLSSFSGPPHLTERLV